MENIQIKYREKKVENTEKKHTTHIRNVFRIVEEEERRKTYVEKKQYLMIQQPAFFKTKVSKPQIQEPSKQD